MGSSPLSKFPISRIVVPFCGGILLGNCTSSTSVIVPVAIAISGCLLSIFISVLSRSPEARNKIRPYTIVPIAVISMALGWTSHIVHQPATINLSQVNGTVAYGQIVNMEFKVQSMRITVNMLSNHSQGSKLLLTTHGCNYNLKEGDNIAFMANFQVISNPNLEEDVDYAKILKRKGIIYQQHIDSKGIISYGHHETITSIMASARNSIKQSIYQSTLSTESKHYIIALLLGDKKLIDQQTRTEYSYAGIAHVLALSGLHIGIIMMLSWILFWPLDYYGQKKLRFILSVALLALYDLLTGLSPSAIRATVMITFTFATFIFGRKSSAINALMASALLILTFSPESIFDVGFQLSFITVFFILIFSPRGPIVAKKKKWLNYLVSLIATSAIAMCSTIALTAYYFHSISWVGVISNLLILPIFPLIMGISAIVILLACVHVNVEALNRIADALLGLVNNVAHYISQLPYAFTKDVYVSEADVVCYTVFIILVFLFIRKRKWIYLNCGIACCAIGIVCHTLAMASFKRSGCVLFNSYDSTPIFFYENRHSYCWTPDDSPIVFNKEKFHLLHTGFFAAHRIEDITLVNDSSKIPGTAFRQPYALIYGKTILVAGRQNWRTLPNSKKATIDYCIITRHFNGKVTDLARHYNIRLMVISGNVYEPNVASIISSCKKLGIKVANLREKSLVVQ